MTMNQNIDPTITAIFIPVRPTSKGLQGFANLTINNHLALNGIAVYTKPSGDGCRLVFPLNKAIQNQTFYFCPISKDFGDLLTKAVSDKINSVVNKTWKEFNEEVNEKAKGNSNDSGIF